MERYAEKVGVRVLVESVEIATAEDVERYRFIGSPTVRIGGLDVDPLARGMTNYGFS